MTNVAIASCNTYHPDELRQALARCLERVELQPPRGARVLIKPNAVMDNRPDQATATHPAVLDVVCAWLAEAGCRIGIGDSSAYYFPGFTRQAFHSLGFAEVARRYGARLHCFEERPFRIVPRPHCQVAPQLYVADLSAWDMVVNLPKLKVHRISRISAAVKNLFGLVPGGAKQRYHDLLQPHPDYLERFGTLLNDVWLQVRPALNILDGVVGLGRDGPAANGDPVRARFLMASSDAMALDLALCRVLGEDPQAVSTLSDALRRNLLDPDAVRLLGQPLRVAFPLLEERPPAGPLARRATRFMFGQLRVRPRADGRLCQRCGRCVRRCQLDAIQLDERHRIDERRCISCYACPSFCEAGALQLAGSPVFHLLQAARRLTGM